MSKHTERDPLLAAQNNTETPKTPTNGPLRPSEISTSTRYGILAGIWMSTFLSSANMTLVATLLPSISSEFHKSNQAGWLGTSYLLAVCTFTPLYGRLSNVLGRRGANQTAVILTGIGTLACGLSTRMETLIAARFIAGLGGGGVFTMTSIITSDMYSMRERGLIQGMASMFNGLGMGLGGPIGGLVSDWLGWRWPFLMQMPLFLISFGLTQYYLCYVIPGRSKSAKEVLMRIDYGGSLTLLVSVGSFLVFLSTKYNEGQQWTDLSVILPLVLSGVFAIAFVIVELFIAPEPVLAPFLLKQKIPVLIGISNFLVSLCNFTVTYFFPTWFQTVVLTSSSVAGLHLMPNSLSMSAGSMFAGWMMHRTGKYRMMTLTFGCLPFIATLLITFMKPDSPQAQQWLGIIPLGLGNGIVLQTTLIALFAHLPESLMAVGTGFAQLFRGLGQLGGVAISSAMFQSVLDHELHARIKSPDADDIIKKIRQSAKLIASLPPDLQAQARDSYAVSLRAVFILAACSTLLAFIVRLPIPDKALGQTGRPRRVSIAENVTATTSTVVSPSSENLLESGETTPDEETDEETSLSGHAAVDIPRSRVRRLSTFEDVNGSMDLEHARIGGSARQNSFHFRSAV